MMTIFSHRLEYTPDAIKVHVHLRRESVCAAVHTWQSLQRCSCLEVWTAGSADRALLEEESGERKRKKAPASIRKTPAGSQLQI